MGIMSFMLSNLQDILIPLFVLIASACFFYYIFFWSSIKRFTEDAKGRDKCNLVSILKYIIDNGVHLSVIETDYAEPCGKLVANHITRTTNAFFIFLFVIVFIPFLFVTFKLHMVLLFFISVFLLLVLMVRYCSFAWFHWKIKNHVIYLTHQMGKDSTMERKFKVFMRSIFITPFTLRHVWWFVLVCGLVNVQYETVEFVKKENLNVSVLIASGPALGYFLQNFMKLLIISTIAYIATNIIAELMALRERYRIGSEEVKDMNNLLKEYAPRQKEEAERAISTLKASSYGSKILEFLEKLSTHNEKAVDFLDVSAKFTEKMRDEITAISDSSVRLSLLSARTSLFHNQLRTDQNNNTVLNNIILTPWTNLGRISRFLMKDIIKAYKEPCQQFEIYALQLKTPLLFLQKYAPDNPDNIGDVNKDWVEFINENILDKDKITLKRYFAAINTSSGNDDSSDSVTKKAYPQEYFHLMWNKKKNKSKTVAEGLSEKYYVPNEETIKNDLKNNKKTTVILKANGGKADLNSKTVSEILGTIIHQKHHCFVRIFKDIGDVQDEYHSLLLDRSNKLIDYLAIREKNNDNNGKWIFCVRSLYDEDFDTAKIEFLYSGVDGWDDEMKKLESIFINVQSDQLISLPQLEQCIN